MVFLYGENPTCCGNDGRILGLVCLNGSKLGGGYSSWIVFDSVFLTAVVKWNVWLTNEDKIY